MRTLFEYDYKNYKENGTVGIRPSVRGIIIKNGKLALVYSRKYDYYSFAGGGLNNGETNEDALIREIREELGLNVIPESIREYGLIVRKEKGAIDDLFIQENYYYLCDVSDQVTAQQLEGYEIDEAYELRWVTPSEILETNRKHSHGTLDAQPWAAHLFEREERLLDTLISEKLLPKFENSDI